MNLTFVIHDILYKKNFITIPNFGSFISQYQSARIIKSDFVRFIPPHKTINFNPKILQNDGILEQILCDDYQLSPEHAQLEIQAFVNTSKDILDKTKLLLLEGIGSFTLDEKGNINFSPNQEINYLTHSFGLSDFTIQELAQEKILEEFIQKKKDKPNP